MQVVKINPTEAAASEKQSFKALKLKSANIRTAKRALTKDTVELRKALPDSKNSKNLKYLGNPNVGPGPNSNGPYEATTADAVVAGACVAIGLALALL